MVRTWASADCLIIVALGCGLIPKWSLSLCEDSDSDARFAPMLFCWASYNCWLYLCALQFHRVSQTSAGASDLYVQAIDALRNVETALRTAGASIKNVVRSRIFLA